MERLRKARSDEKRSGWGWIVKVERGCRVSNRGGNFWNRSQEIGGGNNGAGSAERLGGAKAGRLGRTSRSIVGREKG